MMRITIASAGPELQQLTVELGSGYKAAATIARAAVAAAKGEDR